MFVDLCVLKVLLLSKFLDGGSDRIFKFNVSIPRQEHVMFTELELYKLPSTQPLTSPNVTVTIHIVDIWSSSLLATQQITMGTTGWISFVLPKRTIRQWSSHPQRNAGISVQVLEKKLSSAVQFSTRQTNATLQPILVIHCRDPEDSFLKKAIHSPNLGPATRNGRSIHSTFDGKCQIHNLTIFFKDLGWDEWFIVPKMYKANYCGGTCLDRYNTQIMSNHAMVQLLLHEKDPSRAHPPCCVPNKMSALSILYFGGPGKSTYVLKKVDDFVVRSCACR